MPASRRTACYLLPALSAVLLAGPLLPQSAPREQPPAPGAAGARPLLEAYCYRCHAGDRPRGDFDLKSLVEEPGRLHGAPKALEKLLAQVEKGEMPPPTADRQPTRDERDRLTAWLRQELADLRRAQADDPGAVVMPRLTRSEYLNAVRDMTGVAVDAGRYLPLDGGAGEGFTNVGAAQSITLEQMEKFLEASRLVVSHLRASPAGGLRWHPAPLRDVPAPADARQEVLDKLTLWHADQEVKQYDRYVRDPAGQVGMTHGAYLEAAWRYRFRGELGQPGAGFADIAAGYDTPLSPTSLERWWRLLNADQAHPLLQELRRRWQALPGPGRITSEEVRQRCRDIDRHLDGEPWRQGFAPAYEVGLKFDNKRRASPPKEAKDGRWPFTIEVGKAKELYLVTTDAGDGNRGDVVTWRRGVFETKAGEKTPWRGTPLTDRDGKPAARDQGEDAAVTVQAPAVLRLAVPAGTKRFTVEAAAASPHGQDASVQALVLRQPPAPEDVRFYPGRHVFGPQGSAAVGRFEDGLDVVRTLFTRRNRRVVDSNDLHARTQLNAERNVIPGFVDLDLKYLGGPWADQREEKDDPTHLYFKTAGVVRREADPAAREELELLRRELLAAAQPELQDLAAFLTGHGLPEAREGVPPPDDLVAQWDAATRAEFTRLQAAAGEAEAGRAAAAREQLRDFGLRAWRRPLTEAELDRLTGLFAAERRRGAGYDAAFKVPLRVILVSPHFLYRHQDSRQSADPYPLDGYEVASRLSFFLWASIPDGELLRLAAGGRLRDPEVLRRQTRRMLADPRAKALATEFAGQWLDFAGFADYTGPDPDRFPEFTPSLRQAMYDECVLFCDHVFRTDRPLLDLIDGDYTFANEELAKHYGIAGVTGPGMRRVPLPRGRRGGVLGMGAVLTRTSQPLRTSPVHRGVWVLEQVLGEHLPPPPDDVPMLPGDEKNEAGLSVARQLARHRADPACASCHDRIDPLGLALENFDPVGRWRDRDLNGVAIDGRAEFPDGRVIDGVPGLGEHLLTRRDDVLRQFCRKLLGYALGRAVQPGDENLLRSMQDALQQHDYRLTAALDRVVTSRQFLYRRDVMPAETTSEAP